ncbi:MAG: hypothetical protein OXH38_08715 [Chloroflexi bacterium]|nr:hypothetical protein [Chloroflexota bacterium]
MHRASPSFWATYRDLPQPILRLANRRYQLFIENPSHRSLRIKKAGDYWSVRVDRNHRAVAVRDGEDYVWFWIGRHDEYVRIINPR